MNQQNNTDMYTVYNNLVDKNVFNGNEVEFIHFMRKIAVENGDNEISITCLSEAKEYLEAYCPALELVK